MSSNCDTITKTLSSVCCFTRNLKQYTYDSFSICAKPPPPTLEEILATFNAQEDGDKELLAAIIRAKEAEDLVSCATITNECYWAYGITGCQRIAAVASLQETIVQLQHVLVQSSGALPLGSQQRSQATKTARRRTSTRATAT